MKFLIAVILLSLAMYSYGGTGYWTGRFEIVRSGYGLSAKCEYNNGRGNLVWVLINGQTCPRTKYI